MSFNYAVLGAGRQGVAAAYDMARWGDAAHVVLADLDLALADRAANRINTMNGDTVAEAVPLDVTDLDAVEKTLTEVDSFLSAYLITITWESPRRPSKRALTCATWAGTLILLGSSMN